MLENQGPQPLDALLTKENITNHDLVKQDGNLYHKMIQKGRTGRPLTLRSQLKILNAVNTHRGGDALTVNELFSYRGR